MSEEETLKRYAFYRETPEARRKRFTTQLSTASTTDVHAIAWHSAAQYMDCQYEIAEMAHAFVPLGAVEHAELMQLLVSCASAVLGTEWDCSMQIEPAEWEPR